VGPQPGDDHPVQVADGLVEGAQDLHEGEHGRAPGGGLSATGQAGWGGAQAAHECGRRGPAAVAVAQQEGGHAPLPETHGRLGGWVARQEGQGDLAFDVGEDGLGAGPEGVQGGGELVDGGHALADEVLAGAHGGTQRSGGVRERAQHAQLVAAQPQVVGDHRGVAGIGLGPGDHLGVAPGLDRVGMDWHHGVAGLQQPVDQAAVGPFDGDGELAGFAEPAQAADQVVESGCGVGDAEGAHRRAGVVQHADGVRGCCPVDPNEHEA
jgi:hypothetical protein